MMLSCSEHNGCEDGMMFSFMYNVPPHIVPSYEWYKPNIKDVTSAEKMHVKQGGLLIRKIKI